MVGWRSNKFQSMQLRRNLSFAAETELRNMLPSEYILPEFGDRVAKALKKVIFMIQ